MPTALWAQRRNRVLERFIHGEIYKARLTLRLLHSRGETVNASDLESFIISG